jgi:ketosteroid isomerase-like protein
MDTEAIHRLKYAYLRALDTKRWDELADTFADDATVAYDSGRYSFQGKPAIMEFLRGALGDPKIVSMHHAHHPEIEMIGEGRARGRWYLEDMVIFTEANLVVRGAAFYDDRYIRQAGRWRIAHTGYERTFEEMVVREKVQQFRSMFEGER